MLTAAPKGANGPCLQLSSGVLFPCQAAPDLAFRLCNWRCRASGYEILQINTNRGYCGCTLWAKIRTFLIFPVKPRKKIVRPSWSILVHLGPSFAIFRAGVCRRDVFFLSEKLSVSFWPPRLMISYDDNRLCCKLSSCSSVLLECFRLQFGNIQ